MYSKCDKCGSWLCPSDPPIQTCSLCGVKNKESMVITKFGVKWPSGYGFDIRIPEGRRVCGRCRGTIAEVIRRMTLETAWNAGGD